MKLPIAFGVLRTFHVTLLLMQGAIVPANAQSSLPITLNFSGTGIAGSQVEVLSASGSISPLGPAKVTITVDGGDPNYALIFNFIGGADANGNAPTLSAFGPAIRPSPDSPLLKGAAKINDGTGRFATAGGSFQFIVNAPNPGASQSFSFTLTGSGTLTAVHLQQLQGQPLIDSATQIF